MNLARRAAVIPVLAGFVLTSLVAGCSSGGSGGQIPASLSLTVPTPGLGAVLNGDENSVGTPESAFAWVTGPAGTVIVRSVSMVALPGFRLPRLEGIGAMPGCTGNASLQENTNASGRLQVLANGRAVRLHPVPGYRMTTGRSDCTPAFAYVVSAATACQYALAGFRFRVLADGRNRTVVTFDEGAFIWYYASGKFPAEAQYERQYNAAFSAQSQAYSATQGSRQSGGQGSGNGLQ